MRLTEHRLGQLVPLSFEFQDIRSRDDRLWEVGVRTLAKFTRHSTTIQLDPRHFGVVQAAVGLTAKAGLAPARLGAADARTLHHRVLGEFVTPTHGASLG